MTTSDTAEAFAAALNAGARGVLTHPFGLEDLDHRLSSMLEWSTRRSGPRWPTAQSGSNGPAGAAG